MNSKKTGLFLQSLRKEKGITQYQVAKELFVSPKTVSKWERGEGLPDISIISSLADFYSVTTDEILKGMMNSEHVNRAFIDQKKQIEEKRKKLSKLFDSFFYVASSVLVGLFIASISVFLIKIISRSSIDPYLAPEMMFIGIILASIIVIISDSLIARSYKNDSAITSLAKKDIRKSWRRKELMFILISIICMTIALFEFLLRNIPFPSDYLYNVCGFAEDIILIALLCLSLIFILTSFFKEETKIHKTLKNRLFISLAVVSLYSLFFLTNISFDEQINTGGSSQMIYFRNLPIIFLFNSDIKVFFYRGFSIFFLVIFVISFTLSFIKKKFRWMIAVSYFSSLLFNMFCSFELEFINPYVYSGSAYHVISERTYSSEFTPLNFIMFFSFFTAMIIINRKDRKTTLK